MRKKNLKKSIALGVAGLLSGTMCFSSAGCGPKVPDTEETLEVFVAKLGYGAAWCEEMLNVFKNQEWVKAKYPALNIIFEASDDRSVINTRMAAGAGRNTLDLVMSDSISALGADRSGVEFSCNLTETVYNTTVPGESVTVYQKLLEPYKKSLQWYGVGESALDEKPFKAYDFNWASGIMSIIYNEELLQSFGYDEAPRTTEEFIEVCRKASNDQDWAVKHPGGYSIMWSGGANYWTDLFPVFWGQYEGAENYYNYWNGLFYDGRNYIEKSPKVFEQVGRKEALAALTSIINEDNGFMYTYGNSLEFKAAQKNFINGDGLFMANGDYFANEMAEDIANSQYTIRLMKTPILSSIINKTPTITTENQLRTVISRIDSGCATVADAKAATPASGDADISGVSQADYKIILEARAVAYTVGTGHHTCIPTYAKGKEIAFDFLRFMATDTAQEIYMRATGGASLPFKYDVQTKNPTLYDGFYDMQKDRLTYEYNTVHGINILPASSTFPLARYGDLGMWSNYGLSTKSIVGYAMDGGDAKVAWERDIDYWQSNNAKLWSDALRLAGLN